MEQDMEQGDMEQDTEHAHGDLTSLAPHERLPEILVVPREKTPTGAAQMGKLRLLKDLEEISDAG